VCPVSVCLCVVCGPPLLQVLVSPLADTPVRADLDFEVPACYKHNPPRLQPGYLAKFKEETLFYIFYSMPQVRCQAA
jgi:CCR4-NOT transcription complex subunit 2